MARNLNAVVAGLFVLFGVVLSVTVTKMNRPYAGLYDDWDSSPLLAAQAFHWPFYVWFLACMVPAIGTYRLRKLACGRALAAWSLGSFVLFLALAAAAMDWLTGFVFCHSWGCSRFL
jgi:hypothetical protein